ncbi:hypothetical protein DWY20_10690 [Phocaeicola coprocola]|uniref:Uncharacterized protein n=1 Tax=Phocaeicola coprocola TaxID=310298 RepID=A0A412GHC0_9BACT|nr:hypothetical protein DWY20_10690 [Phocaeicola coprocola]
MKIFTSNVLQKTKDSVYLFYYLLINLSNNQTNEKDLTYKVRISYRMYPYLFHTTSRESKKSLSGARQPDYWINRFENHKYFDTHQAPVFDSVNIKALLQQKQPSNIPEKE